MFTVIGDPLQKIKSVKNQPNHRTIPWQFFFFKGRSLLTDHTVMPWNTRTLTIPQWGALLQRIHCSGRKQLPHSCEKSQALTQRISTLSSYLCSAAAGVESQRAGLSVCWRAPAGERVDSSGHCVAGSPGLKLPSWHAVALSVNRCRTVTRSYLADIKILTTTRINRNNWIILLVNWYSSKQIPQKYKCFSVSWLFQLVVLLVHRKPNLTPCQSSTGNSFVWS